MMVSASWIVNGSGGAVLASDAETLESRGRIELLGIVLVAVLEGTPEFLERGGRLETREFHTLADCRGLHESVIVNCTGCGDDSATPDHEEAEQAVRTIAGLFGESAG